MNLDLYFPPGKTAILTLKTRGTETVVGSPITGVPDGSITSKYVFAVTQADGDYDASIAGVSVPAAPRFALRKNSTTIQVANSWAEMNAFLVDPTIPASTAPQVTGYWRCYTSAGVLEPSASITMQNADVESGATGYVLEDTARVVTADASGIASFTGLFVGAKYIAYRTGSSRKFIITVPDEDSPVALGSITG